MKFSLLNSDTNKRLKALEAEIFPKEEKQVDNHYYSWFPYPSYSFNKPLKEQIEDIKNELSKNEKLVEMILDFMKLEYVKITEENGSKETREVLRKKKIVKKKKVEEVEDED